MYVYKIYIFPARVLNFFGLTFHFANSFLFFLSLNCQHHNINVYIIKPNKAKKYITFNRLKL